MRTLKSMFAILACVPLALAASCGGGGGGGDGSTTTTGKDQQSDPPASTTAGISSVPLAGTLLVDCTDNGVSIADGAIDSVNAIAGGSLPASLPKLSEVVAMGDLGSLPVIGGIAVDALGQLESLSAVDAEGFLPSGVPGLADLEVAGQLLAVCSQVVAALPADVASDPAALQALLGNPDNVLGIIVLLDSAGVPVGSLLTTVPTSLVPGSGTTVIPGLTTVPDLTELAPLDTSTLPIVSDTLSTLTTTLLGSLGSNNLLTGTPLSGLVGGLIP